MTTLVVDMCFTLNKLVTEIVNLVGYLIAIVFYVVFSPCICALMLCEKKEQAEPEERDTLVEPQLRW